MQSSDHGHSSAHTEAPGEAARNVGRHLERDPVCGMKVDPAKAGWAGPA